MRRSESMTGGSSSLLVPGDTASIAASREFVRSRLGPEIDADLADDIVLAVSELVTNAIEYGLGDEIEVVVARDPDCIELRVSAAADGLPEPYAEPVGAESLRGRGLQIVAALSDQVAVSAAADVVTVICRFDVI